MKTNNGRNLLDNLYCLLPFTYLGIVEKEVAGLGFQSILDVGCGSGKTFGKLKRLSSISYTVGLDIFAPYIRQAKTQNTYDDYILSEVGSLPFKDNSFDVIVSLQLIEHLDKEEALTALREMERVAKEKVIISTPRGAYLQEAFDNNPYQAHKWAWDEEQMRELDYQVTLYGTRFAKYKGTLLTKIVTYALSIVGLCLSPKRTAGGLICVKRLPQD
ncbi:class I SAM-dependent methyltransferase [Chloroflexota bacterium]